MAERFSTALLPLVSCSHFPLRLFLFLCASFRLLFAVWFLEIRFGDFFVEYRAVRPSAVQVQLVVQLFFLVVRYLARSREKENHGIDRGEVKAGSLWFL